MEDGDLTRIEALMQAYEDHHFTKFLKGKSVIIVGPDTALKGQGLGHYIDQFDVVVRHNTVFNYIPFSQQLRKDYGSRTDILYLSPSCIKDYAKLGSKTLQKIKANQIKYLVYQNGNKSNIYFTGDYCFPQSLEFFKRNIQNSNKLHYAHHESILLTQLLSERTADAQPIVPRTGFISIFDILVHGAKKIKVIGMSFYQGGGHAFRPDVKGELDPLSDHKGNTERCPHDSNIELILMADLMKAYPHLEMVEY